MTAGAAISDGPLAADPVEFAAGRRRGLAWAFGGMLAVEFTALVIGAWVGGGSELVESYLLTNTAFGLAFGACGLLIAVKRPANPIGWLLTAGALAHLTSAATVVWGVYGVDAGWPEPMTRTLSTVFLIAWPFGVGLAFPLALLLFPTGRPLTPRWRWVAGAFVVAGLLFVVQMGTEPDSLQEPGTRSYLELPFYHSIDGFWQVVTLLGPPQLALIVTSLALRYKRGDETERRQLLWLVLAVIVAFAANLQRYVTGDGPILLLLSFQLIPAAVAIAIVRYQLFDIRLVVSRTVLYLLLTLGVIAAYVALVAGLDAVLRRGVGSSVLATMAVAVAFNPVRVRLQGVVDRLLYGDRADPVRAMSRVGERLVAGDGADRRLVLDALRDALRLPYAAFRAGDEVLVESGERPADVHAVPLRIGAETLGELVVGVRSGESRLAAADLRVLELVAGPLALALRSASLAAEVKDSRERIVAGREEERRRLRRDLHDGIGPTLTGVAYKLDAVRNVLREDPERAAAMLAELRAATGAALDDVRRVVHGLRPPSLDELGLAGALRQQATQLAVRHDGAPLTVAVLAPAPMPDLPAAVEVAAYRIAVEGLTNVARHSSAAGAQVRLSVLDGALHVEVTDDGAPNGLWRTGVGLSAMRERAAEVGGVCEAGPVTGGGRVCAVLPTST